MRNLLAGERLHLFNDHALQRVLGVKISVDAPQCRIRLKLAAFTFGRARPQERGMFAGALERERCFCQPRLEHGGARARVGGVHGGALERVGAEPGCRQRLLYRAHLLESAPVRCARDRHLRPAQRCPGFERPNGLERFESGAREDGAVGVSEGEDNIAAGGEHHHGAAVAGFDHAAAGGNRQLGVAYGGGGLCDVCAIHTPY